MVLLVLDQGCGGGLWRWVVEVGCRRRLRGTQQTVDREGRWCWEGRALKASGVVRHLVSRTS